MFNVHRDVKKEMQRKSNFLFFQFNETRITNVHFNQTRILNASHANLGQFPWQALLIVKYHNENRVSLFNGVILNHLWIFTTAYGLPNARSIRVDVGHVNINYPALRINADMYVMHPQYNPYHFANNLAVVRMPLNNSIRFPIGPNPSYWPIRLPTLRQRNELFVGAEAYYSAWSSVRPSKYFVCFAKFMIHFFYFFLRKIIIVFSDDLLYASQTVISNQVCLGYYGNNAKLISPDVICSISMDARQGACIGNGGAPLVINEFGIYTLIGTLSFLHGTGSCGLQQVPVPTVFTRITSHFDWIARTTGYQFRA